ncbi:hypothetical protein BTUL_0275g00120 [Botrytis tulipae]|uniref:Uncharacterized protein n=1 Tax=Botrytis tulipae TaxID=87230 RepID=A0A4Z1E7S9_9HELO|nr:hypothetical protein BTUL_0275g00120 [Botrytis tulipae]
MTQCMKSACAQPRVVSQIDGEPPRQASAAYCYQHLNTSFGEACDIVNEHVKRQKLQLDGIHKVLCTAPDTNGPSGICAAYSLKGIDTCTKHTQGYLAGY